VIKTYFKVVYNGVIRPYLIIASHKKINKLFFFNFITVPPTLTTQPTDKAVIESTVATFHCNATGRPVPKITWTKDGKTVSTESTLSFVADRNHSGEYWCSADNGLNTTANASAYLDVLCKCEFFMDTPKVTVSR